MAHSCKLNLLLTAVHSVATTAAAQEIVGPTLIRINDASPTAVETPVATALCEDRLLIENTATIHKNAMIDGQTVEFAPGEKLCLRGSTDLQWTPTPLVSCNVTSIVPIAKRVDFTSGIWTCAVENIVNDALNPIEWSHVAALLAACDVVPIFIANGRYRQAVFFPQASVKNNGKHIWIKHTSGWNSKY